MSLDDSGYSFLFEVLEEKHNAVIRKIREIPPWEWEEEFLELEPQVLRFLGTSVKHYPECAAFKTAYTLASALAVYRLTSRKPKTLTEQEREECIAANRDLVDEYSDALLRAYKDIFPFLLKTHGGTAFDATTAIIETIKAEHERTRKWIEETNGLVQKVLTAIASVISAVATAARQIIKTINTRNSDGLDITGPRTPECRDQVLAVVIWLANPKHPQNVHHACDRTFRFVENGFSSAHVLFLWCQRNESRLWALVDSYRLNHDIN